MEQQEIEDLLAVIVEGVPPALQLTRLQVVIWGLLQVGGEECAAYLRRAAYEVSRIAAVVDAAAAADVEIEESDL